MVRSCCLWNSVNRSGAWLVGDVICGRLGFFSRQDPHNPDHAKARVDFLGFLSDRTQEIRADAGLLP